MKMKQLILAAATVVALAGCVKSMDAVPDPYVNPNPPQGPKMSFQASIDGPYSTKVSVPTSDFYTVWDEGDQVLVQTPTKSAVYTSTVGGDIWTNLKYTSGDAPEGDETVQFFFPSDFLDKGLPAKYNFKDISKSVVKNYPMGGEILAGETEVKFLYLCGIAKFYYENAGKSELEIKSIEMSSNSPLSGKGTVTLGQTPTLVLDGNAGITVNFDAGFTLGPGESFTMCIPLPAQTYKKFTFLINLEDADPIEVKYAGKLTIVRASETDVNMSYIPGPDDPLDGEDLSKTGTANCYIVTAGGSYRIPAVKGNSPATETIANAASAEVLWETINDYEAPEEGDLISYIDFTRGWVVFDVNAGALGNALLAVKDASGNILWSWHIWMTDKVPGVEEQGKTTFMDRHLGATKAITSADKGKNANYPPFTPLTYQWGRKDPFPGCEPNTASGSRTFEFFSKYFQSQKEIAAENKAAAPVSMQTAIENPTMFYYGTGEWCSDPIEGFWASKKTIYDPCPAGYKVPDHSAFEAMYGQAWTNSSGLYLQDGSGIYWPNVLTIKGTDGKIGAGNTQIFWDNSSTTVTKVLYNSPVSGKFCFQAEKLSSFPHTTGAYIRCQAE